MSLFITGTGTGVGKTVVTAGLAALLKRHGISFCVYKPIQTGSPDPNHPEDLDTVKKLVGTEVDTFCSYCFPLPTAPYAADPERSIRPLKLLHDFKQLQAQYSVILVEGAGGVRVPIAPHFEMLDLIRMFQIPVLVVTHPQLGTINHTLLTVDALKAQRLDVKGVVISAFPDRHSDEGSSDAAITSLVDTLEPFLSVPILGCLPIFPMTPGILNPAASNETLQAFEALGLLES